MNHYFPSVRPSVYKIITVYRKILGVYTCMEKRAFYLVRFRALEILGFSKACPKVALAVNSEHGRDPVLMNFSEILKIFVLENHQLT